MTRGPVPDVPGKRLPATLGRFRFAPQATYTVFPGVLITIGYVEAGELVFSMDGPVPVIRGVAPEAPVEIIAANTQFTLGPGDSMTLRPHTGGLIRNYGPDPAQLAAVQLLPDVLAHSLRATPVP